MSKLIIQFCPSAKLNNTFNSGIQKLIEHFPDAPIPDTPNNSLIFIPQIDQNIIGYASVTIHKKSAQISSIFIHPEYQGRLFGFKLMLDILDKLTKTGCQLISLNCSEVMLSFFQSLGFTISNEHIILSKRQPETFFKLENACPDFFLNTLKATLKNKNISLAQFKKNHRILTLSDDRNHYQYHDQSQFLALHRNMLSQAKKQIWIISDAITSPLLNDEIIRNSMLRLAKRNSKAEIKILLEDDKKGAGYYNPTVELAQKLTSFIEIRTIQKGAKKPNEMITTVDFTAGIFRRDLNNYAGFADYHNHLIAQRLRDKFEHHWQYAKPSMQLRRLSI